MIKKFLEGSQAIAEIINLIKPDVVCAYPITPQTHIVEDLAQLKADGKATYDYIRSESEFAAASIVLGASAAGSRTYTATSSQGLLLMTEVLFNIAGMRLPVVMTCANRAISAPINIWNDQQDIMTVRDAGIILLFAENNQESINLHLLAYKVAEKTNLPVIVNVDGFVLTHTMEPILMPEDKKVQSFVKKYQPKEGAYLNTDNPCAMGCVAAPEVYMEIRQELHDDLIKSKETLVKSAKEFESIFGLKQEGLVEYFGHPKAKTIFVAMGSVCSTIKQVLSNQLKNEKIGLLKVISLRPFPSEEIYEFLKKAKNIAVLDKSISLGADGVLAGEIKRSMQGKLKSKIQSFIVGLGGRDVRERMIVDIAKKVEEKGDEVTFVGK